MLRRTLIDLASALAFVATAAALVAAYASLIWLGHLAIRWSLEGRGVLVAVALGLAGVVIVLLGELAQKLLPEHPLQPKKTVRLAAITIVNKQTLGRDGFAGLQEVASV